MLVAAINRCLVPTSKLQMPAWLPTTHLPHWLRCAPSQFLAPRFWDNMELLGEAQIAAISEALAQCLLETCQLDLSSLIFDCTNFDTFLDPEKPIQLPQCRRAKGKRTDLRIVGLALLVSVDFHVPRLWKVYPGNPHDSLTVAQALQELTTRYQALARGCHSMTLIFDTGNNLVCNQELLEGTGFHFAGSLVPTHFPDLLALPLPRLRRLPDPRLQPTRALRLTRPVWGCQRTLLITLRRDLQRKQTRGIEQHLAKKRRALDELQAKLPRSQRRGAKGKGYTGEGLAQQAKQICSDQHMAALLRVFVTENCGRLKLAYRTDGAAYVQIKAQQLGKRILFTDQDSWTNEQIVLAYCSQSQVEDAFADMKDPHFLGCQLMFHHWTDSKMCVHAFYCVLALILESLLQRRASQNGLSLSIEALLRVLGDIQEVANVYPPTGEPGSPGRPSVKITLMDMDRTQQALYRLSDLGRYRKSKG
jgi:hypothetical protein